MPSKCYATTLPITRENNNILDLIPLIPQTFHTFYQGLKTSDIPKIYPDIEEHDANE
jgi:hypothetical protein